MRIILSVVVFTAVVGLADLLGHGHGFGAFFALAAMTVIGSDLPRRLWAWLFVAMLVLSVGMAAVAALQIFYMPRPRGLFISPNFLAGYAALHLCLGAFVRSRFPRFGAIAMAANLFAVVASQSRGGLLAVAAGLLVIFWRRRPRVAVGVVAVAVAAGFAEWALRMKGISEPRWGLWRIGIEGALYRPILGWGWDTLYNPFFVRRFYNVAIDVAVASGGLGLVAAMWMMVEAARGARRLADVQESDALLAFLVAWLVYGMFIYATPAVVLPLYAVLAFLASERRQIPDVARVVDDLQPLLDRGV